MKMLSDLVIIIYYQRNYFEII